MTLPCGVHLWRTCGVDVWLCTSHSSTLLNIRTEPHRLYLVLTSTIWPHLAAVRSEHSRLRSEAERKAVNSVCQGSAADLIKHAMIRIDQVRGQGRHNLELCMCLIKNMSVHREKILPLSCLGV